MPSSPFPLWPAPLHHLALESPDPDRLADFLAATLRMRREPARGGGAVLVGPDRLIVLGPGPEPGARHVAYAMDDPARVEELRARFTSRGNPTDLADSPFFRSGSFRVSAPDGGDARIRRSGGAASGDGGGRSVRAPPARGVSHPGARAAPLLSGR